MLAFLHRILDWFKSVFWKEEMELALVGLQNSGKTTFVNVIAVRLCPLFVFALNVLRVWFYNSLNLLRQVNSVKI